jgi:hypothetical protein
MVGGWWRALSCPKSDTEPTRGALWTGGPRSIAKNRKITCHMLGAGGGAGDQLTLAERLGMVAWRARRTPRAKSERLRGGVLHEEAHSQGGATRGKGHSEHPLTPTPTSASYMSYMSCMSYVICPRGGGKGYKKKRRTYGRALYGLCFFRPETSWFVFVF